MARYSILFDDVHSTLIRDHAQVKRRRGDSCLGDATSDQELLDQPIQMVHLTADVEPAVEKTSPASELFAPSLRFGRGGILRVAQAPLMVLWLAHGLSGVVMVG